MESLFKDEAIPEKRLLEARAKGRTSEAIKKLMGLQAKTARIERIAGRPLQEIVDIEQCDRLAEADGENLNLDAA